MANRLAGEKSPYLLQHQANPVDWYPWGEEAFEKAAREDKPVFLSIGYSTCHWCHVMARESFEDEGVAAVLNRYFVSVKVDREERPDVDAVYMAACQAMTGSGGWPLTVLMTPEKKPFFAGTYFPRPGLAGLLRTTAELWERKRETLLLAGEELSAAVRDAWGRDGAGRAERGLLRETYTWLEQLYDSRWGGFGRAPKFPTPHNLLFLMEYAWQEGEERAQEMAERSLEAMARGGLFDQIGGGFSRYSTDEKWLVPHFEKMLYDNALLLLAYLQAWQQTKKPLYADVARRTADYMLRELSGTDGGFCCGQDADSEGEEGKYYALTPREVEEVLGTEDGQAFCRLYGVTERGNFPGGSVPNRLEGAGEPWAAGDVRLRRLYEYRKKRTTLHRDDKILLSWNAWAITALARAGLILQDERYMSAALDAQDFIERRMTGAEGRLFRRYRDGEAAYPGQLEDYAVYALALLTLYGVTLRPSFLSLALRRAGEMRHFFEDGDRGGYFLNAGDAEELIARPKESYDGALPSGNSVAAMVLEELAVLTGEDEWWEAAERQRGFLALRAREQPGSCCFGLLALARSLYRRRELLCAAGEKPAELTDYLRRRPLFEGGVLFKSWENGEELARLAPFTAAYPVPEEGARWYLCENGACRAPAASLAELEAANSPREGHTESAKEEMSQ